MLILDQQAVTDLLPMRECIDLMMSTLSALARGETILPLRTVVLIPDTNDAFAVMPAYIASPKTMGAKIITVYPGNHGTQYDSHQGAVLLFDPNNGSLAALLDATSVTTIRTAAGAVGFFTGFGLCVGAAVAGVDGRASLFSPLF